jgi:hypothetical protein
VGAALPLTSLSNLKVGDFLQIINSQVPALQFTASYALQHLMYESAAVDLDNYFASYRPTIPRLNLNGAAVVILPFRFLLSVNSSIVTATPVSPIISGIDLNGSGNTSYPITGAVAGSSGASGISHNYFNYGCGTAQLATAVAAYNANMATASTGKKALNGATIPTLTLPSTYQLGTPIISQDVRITKEFAFKERYKFQIFGEFFNLFNISNLTYSAAPVLTSSTFGQPTGRVGQASTFGSGGPRAIQVGGGSASDQDRRRLSSRWFSYMIHTS